MKEELPASDRERGPDPGGGQRSPNLVENMNSQHLVEKEHTASEGKRGPTQVEDRGHQIWWRT